MINMLKLYEHDDYANTLRTFQTQVRNGDCVYTAWGLFKSIHLDISKQKCPICEIKLDGTVTRGGNNGETTIKATIDHYRPKDTQLYPFLKCDDKNYLLMCSECNSMYKGNKFPLYPLNSTRWTEDNFVEEKPLIVNPILDNILELFELIFKFSSSGKKVLELKPKDGLNEYEQLKAEETIRLFGLGDCEENRNDNPNVHQCRIELLERHFDQFYELAKARNIGLDEFLVVLRANPENHYYGFTKFIAKEQFEISVGGN